eukprot:1298008-Ditylum_brightwellii.AAC.1
MLYPRFSLTKHQAVVKALAWLPHKRNLFATGSSIFQTGALLNSINTGSQVCALQWDPFEKEMLSSYNFACNQLCLWKYPTMAKVKELDGHTTHVRHMACSPDGGTVMSAAADKILYFWNIFDAPHKLSSMKRSAFDA